MQYHFLAYTRALAQTFDGHEEDAQTALFLVQRRLGADARLEEWPSDRQGLLGLPVG